MNYFPLTTIQHEWQERTAELSTRDIGPRAEEYDRKAAFPRESLHACATPGCGRCGYRSSMAVSGLIW